MADLDSANKELVAARVLHSPNSLPGTVYPWGVSTPSEYRLCLCVLSIVSVCAIDCVCVCYRLCLCVLSIVSVCVIDYNIILLWLRMAAELYMTTFLSPSCNPSQSHATPCRHSAAHLVLHPVPLTASSRWLYPAPEPPAIPRLSSSVSHRLEHPKAGLHRGAFPTAPGREPLPDGSQVFPMVERGRTSQLTGSRDAVISKCLLLMWTWRVPSEKNE